MKPALDKFPYFVGLRPPTCPLRLKQQAHPRIRCEQTLGRDGAGTKFSYHSIHESLPHATPMAALLIFGETVGLVGISSAEFRFNEDLERRLFAVGRLGGRGGGLRTLLSG